jgi:predicted Fe-Mo cluster-binding NifX family protein
MVADDNQILEIEDGRITARATREWGTDECGSHQRFVDVLAGCDTVLCGGIGQGAVNALVAAGITPLVLARPHTVEEAAALFLAGQLETTGERVCLCGPASA